MGRILQLLCFLLLLNSCPCAIITGPVLVLDLSNLKLQRQAGGIHLYSGPNRPSSSWNYSRAYSKAWNYSKACERDPQCGSGTCCAVSLWLRGLRVCTPLGQEGDECHPFSHKVPFFGKRQHHTCPCLPNLLCSRFLDSRFRCSGNFKNIDF